MSLTVRQSKILEGVCQEFIDSALPVSSQFLRGKLNFPFSSATIRNEFGQLEKENYINHPYVSSGKIPTDKGFRFFVDEIMKEEGEGEKSKRSFFEELDSWDDFTRASYSLVEGIGSQCSGLVFGFFPSREIVWKEGWEKIIKEPEFKDSNYPKTFLKAVNLLVENRDLLDWETGKIKIYIGRENPFYKAEISLLVSEFSLPQEEKGRIAVLGPKRMDFKKNIRLLNSLLDFLEDF